MLYTLDSDMWQVSPSLAASAPAAVAVAVAVASSAGTRDRLAVGVHRHHRRNRTGILALGTAPQRRSVCLGGGGVGARRGIVSVKTHTKAEGGAGAAVTLLADALPRVAKAKNGAGSMASESSSGEKSDGIMEARP